MSLTVGEWMTVLSGVSVAGIGAWTAWGKGRESQWTQAESVRKELQKQLDEFRTRETASAQTIQGIQKRVDDLEAELSRMKGDTRTLLEFLRDVVGGSYDLDWIKKRAQDLLGRIAQ